MTLSLGDFLILCKVMENIKKLIMQEVYCVVYVGESKCYLKGRHVSKGDVQRDDDAKDHDDDKR